MSKCSHVDLLCPQVREDASRGQAGLQLSEDVQKKAVQTSPISLWVTVSTASQTSSGKTPSLLEKTGGKLMGEEVERELSILTKECRIFVPFKI